MAFDEPNSAIKSGQATVFHGLVTKSAQVLVMTEMDKASRLSTSGTQSLQAGSAFCGFHGIE